MRQIVIDSNLLVLLVVGLTDRRLVPKHKRTKTFDIEDYDLLIMSLAYYNEVVVTPHILTETSNLLSQTSNSIAFSLRRTLSRLIEEHSEIFEDSKVVVKHNSFERLGITDSAILRIINKDVPVITTDLDLYLLAVKDNQNTINFNHLREGRFKDN